MVVFRLVSPNNIGIFSTLFGKLGEIVTTKDHLTWNSFVVGKVDTEHWLEIFVKVFVALELGDESWNTIMEWVIEVFLLGWGWSKTDEARSLKSAKIKGLDNSQERDVVDAVVFTLGEADSVGGWVSEDGTSSILNDLSSLSIVMELLRFRLFVFFVLSWAIVGLARVGVDPGSWRTSIEDDLHFLSWVAEVELTFVTHVLKVNEVTSSWLLLHALLVQVMESGVSTLMKRNVQSLIQVHIEFVRKGSICSSLGKLILVWFLGNVDLNKCLFVRSLNYVDLFNINSVDARGEEK